MSEETLLNESAEPAVETTEAPVETSDRPEWLPEKFNDPADLGKAYKELESKLGQKEEDIRAKVMEELNQPKEGVPDSAGDYELPEFVDTEDAANNDLLRQWADHCHENGYTNEEFQRGLELYASALPQEADLEAEAANLGDNAEARIEAASLFANKFFPEDVLPAIERMCETSDGIVALEFMMQQMQDPSVSDATPATGSLTQAKLEEMMRDPRYSNISQRDPHYVKMVDEGFKKLYG
jgi:hypothetical protein